MTSIDLDSALESLCTLGHNYAIRGLAFGSTGNLSVRIGDEIWITPTGQPLRALSPGALARVDREGRPLNDARASKELPFHLAIYRGRPDVAAVVHLHSTYSVALSCLADLDEAAPLPVITPYYVMRVAPLAVVPYLPPGSDLLADAVGTAIRGADVLLLRNHGLIATGGSLNESADRAEELEETARLFFLLHGFATRTLDADEIRVLAERYPRRPAARLEAPRPAGPRT